MSLWDFWMCKNFFISLNLVIKYSSDRIDVPDKSVIERLSSSFLIRENPLGVMFSF